MLMAAREPVSQTHSVCLRIPSEVCGRGGTARPGTSLPAHRSTPRVTSRTESGVFQCAARLYRPHRQAGEWFPQTSAPAGGNSFCQYLQCRPHRRPASSGSAGCRFGDALSSRAADHHRDAARIITPVRILWRRGLSAGDTARGATLRFHRACHRTVQHARAQPVGRTSVPVAIHIFRVAQQMGVGRWELGDSR